MTTNSARDTPLHRGPSVLSLTSSTISSNSSDAARRHRSHLPASSNRSTVFTITQRRTSPTSFSLSTDNDAVPPASATTPTPTPSEPFDDLATSSSSTAPAAAQLLLEADAAAWPAPHTLYLNDSATQRRVLSSMQPLAFGASHAGAALRMRDGLAEGRGEGAVLACVKNVNPATSRAARAHVDMHVTDCAGKTVLMAVRGTNTRHVVIVGPKGRSFIGWMSKVDATGDEEEGVEKWTVSLKEPSDLVVVMWLIVAIDEFYEISVDKTKALKQAAKDAKAAKIAAKSGHSSGNDSRGSGFSLPSRRQKKRTASKDVIEVPITPKTPSGDPGDIPNIAKRQTAPCGDSRHSSKLSEDEEALATRKLNNLRTSSFRLTKGVNPLSLAKLAASGEDEKPDKKRGSNRALPRDNQGQSKSSPEKRKSLRGARNLSLDFLSPSKAEKPGAEATADAEGTRRHSLLENSKAPEIVRRLSDELRRLRRADEPELPRETGKIDVGKFQRASERTRAITREPKLRNKWDFQLALKSDSAEA